MKLRYELIIGKSLMDILVDSLGDYSTLLDLGCGPKSPIRLILYRQDKFTVGIDSFVPYLEASQAKKIHNQYYQMDIRKMDILPKTFDVVMCFDVLEHLTKEEGEKLIADMELIAIKRVIIFTPNGFQKQDMFDNNINQVHQSGWTAQEMRKRGYKVIGVNGLKWMRDTGAYLKNREKWFRIISDVTQVFTYHIPELAFQIMCVKEMSK